MYTQGTFIAFWSNHTCVYPLLFHWSFGFKDVLTYAQGTFTAFWSNHTERARM